MQRARPVNSVDTISIGAAICSFVISVYTFFRTAHYRRSDRRVEIMMMEQDVYALLRRLEKPQTFGGADRPATHSAEFQPRLDEIELRLQLYLQEEPEKHVDDCFIELRSILMDAQAVEAFLQRAD